VASVARKGARSASVVTRRHLRRLSAGWLPRHGGLQYQIFFDLHTSLIRRYRPTTPFDGRVLLVHGGATSEREWSPLVTGPITAVEVASDHLSIIRRPAVQHVGRAVCDALGGR
jgi:hypothetical protein